MAAALLAAAGCDSTLLHRAGQDYFPLVPGSTWKYLRGSDTVVVQVDSVEGSVLGRACRVVYRNYAPEYWIKTATDISRLQVCISGRPNTEDTLEARFGLIYYLPLVQGSGWLETFRDTIVVRGTDTVRFEHRTAGQVAELAAVATPAGTFEDCYRVEVTERVAARDTTTTAVVVWLAPGVGVVRRSVDGVEESLVEYREGE